MTNWSSVEVRGPRPSPARCPRHRSPRPQNLLKVPIPPGYIVNTKLMWLLTNLLLFDASGSDHTQTKSLFNFQSPVWRLATIRSCNNSAQIETDINMCCFQSFIRGLQSNYKHARTKPWENHCVVLLMSLSSSHFCQTLCVCVCVCVCVFSILGIGVGSFRFALHRGRAVLALWFQDPHIITRLCNCKMWCDWESGACSSWTWLWIPMIFW